MKLLLNKILSFISLFAIVFLQIAAPLQVLAQEASPSAEATSSPAPTSEPTLSPTPEPSETPQPSPEATSTPEPTVEPSPTDQPTPAPTTNEEPSSVTSETNQPNAPPSESPIASSTPEPTPALETVETSQGQLSATILENTNAQSLELDLTTQDVSSASLSTDKADYAPTDTAVITGSDFPKEADLKLIITADNYRFEDSVKTDENGSFIYAYQLDGTYRPLYIVEARDENGQVLATTSFTDAPVSGCSPDSAGANDEPGQKDLTKMCVDYAGLPSSIDVDWNWDKTSMPGSNTADACALFDTNNNGLVDYSLCVTWGTSQNQVAGSPTLYSCNDTKVDRCTGALITTPISSTCIVANATDDPFPAGDSYTNDTKATCTIPLSDVGGVNNASLLDVCSYPSVQPNSDPSDCIVFQQNTGKLEVVKALSPSSDTGKFNLQIDGVTEATDVGDGGTTGEKVLDTGDHTVGEIAGTGTDLSSYTSAIVCKDLNGTGSTVAQSSNSGPLTVNLADEQDIVCTITNTLQQGTLTVIKHVVGGTAVASDWTMHINSGSTPDVVPSFPGAESPGTDTSLETGSYTVTEDGGPSDYTLTYSGACDSSGNVTVTAGQTATCTLTNTRDTGTITVNKVLLPSNDSGTFDLKIDTVTYAVGVGNSGSTGQVTVITGSHTVSEDGNNADLSDYNVVIGGDCAADGTVTVASGQDKVCTITNTRLGTIIVEKQTDPNGDQTSFTFTGDAADIIQDGGQITVGNLLPGTYSSQETVPSGWDLTDISCNDTNSTGNLGNKTATFNVAAGETVKCTFTNTKRGHLIVQKTTLPGGDLTSFPIIATGSGTINSGGDGVITDSLDEFYEVTPGTYSVSEFVPDGWDKTGDTCQNVTIAAGDTKTCIITNTKRGEIIVEKLTDPEGSEQTFEFDPDYSQNFFLSDGESNNSELLTPGIYSVSEITPEGWDLTSATCDDESNPSSIGLDPGETVTCTFTNTQRGSISGTKQEVNADSSFVGTLSGWVIQLFFGDTLMAETTTDEDGNFIFNNIVQGVYTLVEQLISGWTKIFAPSSVELDPGGSSTDNNFGNFQNGTISGVKFNDLDGNGEWGEGEPTLSDWTISITGPDEFSNQVITDENGYAFPNLAPGSYTVCEEEQSGWLRTKPAQSNCETVIIENSKQTSIVDFGNQGRGTITVNKNVDSDGDGEVDIQGATDWTWDITEGEQNIPTGDSRTLATGTYTISEDLQAGFALVDWSCSNEQSGLTNEIILDVTTGSDITCTFTNEFVPPVLTLTKTNNKLGADVSPGSDVLYTLILQLSVSTLTNVTLTDLLPNGFIYRPGSWTAFSSERGDLKALGITTEPTYVSPGVWQLGDMVSGEVITLTLIANIAGNIDLGLYRDLAWSKGTTSTSDTILANETSGIFVGTEVNVTSSPGGPVYDVSRTEERVGEILGASIALPQTGADIKWIIAASLLLTFGVTTFALGIKIRRKYE